MKKLLVFAIILASCIGCLKEKNNLENSTWKVSDSTACLTDILFFSDEFLYVKNDSIYWHRNDSLYCVIDTITNHYGERNLYVKSLTGNVSRYCEQ